MNEYSLAKVQYTKNKGKIYARGKKTKKTEDKKDTFAHSPFK